VKASKAIARVTGMSFSFADWDGEMTGHDSTGRKRLGDIVPGKEGI
jgi:hypothetical protein